MQTFLFSRSLSRRRTRRTSGAACLAALVLAGFGGLVSNGFSAPAGSTRLINASPYILGKSASVAAGSSAVVDLGHDGVAVLWLDPDGRIVQSREGARGTWSEPAALALRGSNQSYAEISVTGNSMGWWLAARTREDTWFVWRNLDWSGTWTPVADPASALPGHWLYCPGLVSIGGGVFMPVLGAGDSRGNRIDWLTLTATGQWQRLASSAAGADVPGVGFKAGLWTDGLPATFDPQSGKVMLWILAENSATIQSSGSVWPHGILAWNTVDGVLTAVRSGVRVLGVMPSFPSVGLIVSKGDEKNWQDLGFADETPDQPVGGASFAAINGEALAAYIFQDPHGESQCRLIRLPLERTDRESGWHRLPSYPMIKGVAGMMAGLHRGALIVAGGTNWKKDKRISHDDIFVLLPGENSWRAAGHLPKPRAYGAAVSLPDGVFVVGGEDPEQMFKDTFMLRWDGQTVHVTAGPPLPAAAANPAAAVLDGYVYVAGGYAPGKDRLSRSDFWRLDLRRPAAGWQTLPTWPGPARGQAVMAALDGAIYLISGMETRLGADGKPQSTYLNDAYRYRPSQSWERLPDLPWSALAAPSPAPVTSSPARVFVLGGVDGRQADALPKDAPLPPDILYFDVRANAWKLWPEAWPQSVVNVPAVKSGADWIIPSGECKSFTRTPEVWSWRMETP